MSNATVNMPLDEYHALKKSISESDARIKELLEQVAFERQQDPEGRIKDLVKLARATIEIIQFAVANLSPEVIKRWPWQTLHSFADALVTLPDRSVHDEELATELHKFANECEMWELKRKTEPAREIPPPFAIEDHPLVRLRAGQPIGAELPGSSAHNSDTEQTHSTDS